MHQPRNSPQGGRWGWGGTLSWSAGLALTVGMTGYQPAVAQGQPRSLRELEAQATRDSLDPDALYRLALGYARKKRFDDEARALRQAIAINSRYTPAYVALAFETYARRPSLAREVRHGKVPPPWRDSVIASQRLLHQAFLIDPLADLMPPDIDPREQQFAAVRLQALLWSFRDRPRDSLPPWFLLMRGLMNGRNGLYPSAIEDVSELLSRSEAITNDSVVSFPVATNDFRYILAVLSERAGRPVEAIAFYQQTLTGDLGLYVAHTRLARVYRGQQMWTEAVTEAQRAVEANPEDPATWRELGEMLLSADRLAEAEAALREAKTRNPRDVGTEYVLGVVLERIGRTAEARDSFQRFLSLAPATLYERQLNDARNRLAALQSH